MILCAVIGFGLILLNRELHSLLLTGKMLMISAFSGLTTAIFVVTWLVCVRKSAYMMLDIFLMLGVLIPLIASQIFFSESISAIQWAGIGLLFIAVGIMCSYNNSIKEKITPVTLLLLLVCGISCGLADFSQKLFIKAFPDGSAAVFNFYTYVFAAIPLSFAFVFSRKKGEGFNVPDFRKIFGFIFVMAICLFCNSYFKTLAAKYLDAVILYPLNQGCALILSAVMSSVLFKEKLTAKGILGILIAFCGLLVINVLAV